MENLYNEDIFQNYIPLVGFLDPCDLCNIIIFNAIIACFLYTFKIWSFKMQYLFPRLARTHSNIDDQPIKSEKAVRFSCESIVNQILLR